MYGNQTTPLTTTAIMTGGAPNFPQGFGIPDMLSQIFSEPAIEDSALGGLGLGNLFYGHGSLGRVDPASNPELSEVLARQRAESYIGGYRVPEQQGALDILKGGIDYSSTLDPTASMALDVLSGRLQTPSSVNAAVGRFENADTGLDPFTSKALTSMSSLSGGLTPEEVLDIRESGRSGINREFQTATRNLARGALARGVSGPAASIPLQQIVDNRSSQLQDLENDISLQNLQLKDSRLNNFANFANETGGRDYTQGRLNRQDLFNSVMNRESRLDTAASNVGQTASNISNNRLTANLGARESYQNQLSNEYAREIADRRQRFQDYQNLFLGNMEDDLRRDVFNLGQANNETAGRLGSIFGAAQFGQAQQQSDRSYELGLQGIEAASKPPEVQYIPIPFSSGSSNQQSFASPTL